MHANPDAELFVHPECGCTTSALWLAGPASCRPSAPTSCPPAACWTLRATGASSKVLVATEIGMLHQLRQVNGLTDFEPVNPRAICPFMKMTTPDKLLRCLGEQG